MWAKLFLGLVCVPALVFGAAPTDELQDADPAQSGYLPNHNLHPATVGSSIFGILWKNAYNNNEKFYAKPLTITPVSTGKQVVFLASSMNIIRVVDATTGALINSRTVQPPFLQSDIGCTDIPNFIGIIGTPVIDPSTETVYFFSKGYEGQASSGGVPLGRYRLYGVNVLTLQDVPGFPVSIDGHYADNDPKKYFVGGTVLQRPSLAMINGYVIGAFGGHCDLFNYTGMLVAVSTTQNVGVTSIYAMEGGPAAQPEVDDYFAQQGGKAGIWQGGMGLAVDSSRLFFATGNGQGHANGGIPASGRQPLTTLDEVVADFGISASGKLSLTDYFEPYEYTSMDAADRDLGSGGVALLDPGTFQGTGVSRIAVSIGKNGKAYILNADNLGGFKQGSGGTDNILQTIIASGPVFGGSGSYPLEGGYLYFTPNGQPTVCYKLGHDDNGKPLFTLVGQTKTLSAGRVGIGIPTITTYKGQPGTGILWIGDPNVGLQAFNAVPDNTGTLVPIPLPPTNGLNKFQRPGFGDGKVYVSDSNGNVYCLGSPVALPLNCTQPVDFGPLAIGNSSTLTVTCTALIPIKSIDGCSTQDSNFQCSNSTLPKGALAQGQIFSFPVTWDLTQHSINDAQNASYGKVLPGPVSTSLDIFTTNGVPKYSTVLPISLTGTTVSSAAFLSITPPEVDFGGIVVNGSGVASGLSAAVIISNIGSLPLTFSGVAWTDGAGSSAPYQNVTTNPDGSLKIGSAFSTTALPQSGDQIAAGQSITVPLNFRTNAVGSYQSILEFWSDGGVEMMLLAGSASTSPIVNISVQTVENGWDASQPLVMDFGNIAVGTSTSRNIRMCNSGGSALTVTKSKPPVDAELFAARPLTDLHEGQVIDVNHCAFGEVDIVPAAAVVNQPPELISDVWVLNADGLDSTGQPFGVHEVQIKATIVRNQVGPLIGGQARYKYLGCYQDGNPRLLPKAFNGPQATAENSYCQKTCLAGGYMFAGTEYHYECWCGNTPPPSSVFHPESEKRCTFACPGDTTQACGGNGGFTSVFYDSTRYSPNGTVSSSSSSLVQPSTSSTSVVSSAVSTSSNSASTISTTSVITTITSSSTSTSVTGGPSVVPTIGAFAYQGCYAEPAIGHAMPVKIANNSMTEEMCASLCSAYAWFGVEYARECYCGNTLAAGTTGPGATGCTMLCKGNTNEYCGGSLRLNLYSKLVSSASSSMSSTSSATSSTSLSSSSTYLSSFSSAVSSIYISSTSSFSASTDASVSISSISATSSILSSATSSPTSSISSSTTSSDMSSTTSLASTSISSVTTLITTTTSSSTVITATALGYYPQGCYADPASGVYGGHFMKLLVANDSMNVEFCISAAKARLFATPATTFSYIGVEYGRECYAGTALPTGTAAPAITTGAKACTMACKGNPSEMCGGRYMMNLYMTSTPAPAPTPRR